MHSSNDDISMISLCNHPKSLLSRLLWLTLLFDEASLARLGIGVDFCLIFLLNVLWLVDERQVLLSVVGYGADVKAVPSTTEQTIHGNCEGQF